MEILSALLAFYAGNSPITSEFPTKKASDAELWCFLWSAPETTVVGWFAFECYQENGRYPARYNMANPVKIRLKPQSLDAVSIYKRFFQWDIQQRHTSNDSWHPVCQVWSMGLRISIIIRRSSLWEHLYWWDGFCIFRRPPGSLITHSLSTNES